jgi:hypothetical protein
MLLDADVLEQGCSTENIVKGVIIPMFHASRNAKMVAIAKM